MAKINILRVVNEITRCGAWGVEEERWILSPLETYPSTQVVKKEKGRRALLRIT